MTNYFSRILVAEEKSFTLFVNFLMLQFSLICSTPLGPYLLQENIYFIEPLSGVTLEVVNAPNGGTAIVTSNSVTEFKITLQDAQKFVQ